MSADRGQLRTMWLLPFTAAADEAARVVDPRHDRRLGPASRPIGRVLCSRLSDHGELTAHAVWPATEISAVLISSGQIAT